ncbi:unnamed protein product [Mucor hiemalis]
MIWHIYGNNEKLVINEQQPQIVQQRYTPSISSSEDTVMQTDEEGDYSAAEEESINTISTLTIDTKGDNPNVNKNKSLFLNFTSDLYLQETQGGKKKKLAANNNTVKPQASFKVNGVNILNRKNLDSKTVIDRIQKRRENHNHVERRRRDCINNTILELSHIIPNASLPGQKLNKGNVLKLAVDHILHLQSENALIKHQLMNQVLESRDSVQSSPHLIGNTSHNMSPAAWSSTTELSTVNSNGQYQSSKNPAVASLRPLLPALAVERKVTIPRIIPRSPQQMPPPPQQKEHVYPHSNADQNSSAAYFIENKLYYKGTCRYLQ